MVREGWTTISIPRELKEQLENLKIHPRQPIAEVIAELVKSYRKPSK